VGNRLPFAARWKILDNLRRSLIPAATVLLLLIAWLGLPGRPAIWTWTILTALVFGPAFWLVEAVAGPQPWQPWRVLLRNLVEDTTTAAPRAFLPLVFLAYQSVPMTHSILVTLFRVTVTTPQ